MSTRLSYERLTDVIGDILLGPGQRGEADHALPGWRAGVGRGEEELVVLGGAPVPASSNHKLYFYMRSMAVAAAVVSP